MYGKTDSLLTLFWRSL